MFNILRSSSSAAAAMTLAASLAIAPSAAGQFGGGIREVALNPQPLPPSEISLSGAITFAVRGGEPNVRPNRQAAVDESGGWMYLREASLKINCSRLRVDASDAHGRTVASTTATRGAERDTCVYALRVPAKTALTITVHQGTPSAIIFVGGDGTFKDVSADDWGAAEMKRSPEDSQTVPIAIVVNR